MRKLLFLLFVILLFGCGNSDKPKKPDNLIPKDKMEAILYDSFVLNAAKASNRKVLEKNGIYPLDRLYEKHKIDSATFAESNAYYAYDIESYKAMIDNVKSKLESDKKVYTDALKKEEEIKKKKQDSIKEARKNAKDSLKKLGPQRKKKANSLKKLG